MPYNAQIPQANDQLSVSQPEILANFQALEPVGNGFMSFTEGANPPQVNDATHILLFNALGTFSGVDELLINRNTTSGLPVPNYSITEYQQGITVGALTHLGWTRLASGILLKWGKTPAIPAVTGLAVNLTLWGPAFTVAPQPFIALVTPLSGGGANGPVFQSTLVTDTQLSLTSLTVGTSGGAYFLVIGL